VQAAEAAFRRLLREADWREPREPRNPQGLLQATHVPTGLTFVLVPGGTFSMGGTRHDAEKPLHRVDVPEFLLCTTPCTQRSFDRVGGNSDRSRHGRRLPIEGVSWRSAVSWCRDAGLRLPSEAEWEHACRAGTVTGWGGVDNGRDLLDHAWYEANSGGVVHEVATRRPNPWGLYDMHGNVWEWCEDTWHRNYAGAPNDGSAWTSGATASRVVRGGGAQSTADACRSAQRDGVEAVERGPLLGFRPAMTLPGFIPEWRGRRR
jgi:formylglycine-generating enzyme required for sulfatase activity